MPVLRASAIFPLFLCLSSLTAERTLPSSPSAPKPLALEIETAGIYRLGYGYLARHHFNPARVDVRQLGLSDSGAAVPIYVHHANGDGHVFGQQDYIEFYAHPVFNTYTGINTYVLSDSAASVKRVRLLPAAKARSAVTVAPNTYVDRQRTFFDPVQDSALPYTVSTAWPSTGDPHWREMDLVVGTQQPTTSQGVDFSLASPAAAGNCEITAPASGYADEFTAAQAEFQMSLRVGNESAINSSDGTTSFTWNAAGPSGDTTANGSFGCSALGSSPGGYVRERVAFSSSLQSEVQLAEVFPQYFAITYPEHLCAVANRLSWTGSGPSEYAIAGFDSGKISVWRVAQSGITRFTGINSVSQARGACGPSVGYTASFGDGAPGPASYFATTRPLTPKSSTSLALGNLTSGRFGSVRYLIVTSPQFVSVVRPLAQYHDKQGLPARIVTTQAIYDQYRSRIGRFFASNGATAGPGDAQLNPEAIRAYVDFAVKNLGVEYVLLAGGDTLDPHNFYGCPQSGLCADANPRNVSVVPTLYEDSIYGGPTESDNLYAVPLGQSTVAPDVAIGRLPAVTASGLKTEVARSMLWGSWVRPYEKTATFVSGFASAENYGGSCADPEFPSASDQMASVLPSGWNISKEYEDGIHAHDAANRSRFLDLFDRGQEIINYVGHGNLQQWSCLPEFTSTDVGSLTNTKRLAAVFQWGCQATDFVNPRLPNLDSLLLQAKKGGRPTGAVIAVGSSGLDLAGPQAQLGGGTDQAGEPPYFYGYLALGESVGQALQHAKDNMVAQFGGEAAYADFADVVNSYTLLGDPALTLPM